MDKDQEKTPVKITGQNLSQRKSHVSALSVGRRLNLIQHDVGGEVVAQRPTDGYINATALCQSAGKQFAHYHSNASTKSFLEVLEADIGIPRTELIQTLRGGLNPKIQGTWVHPKVALHLAQWLSPWFAVQVTNWVHDWMFGTSSGYMPEHVKRYMKNRSKIPHTHFSMLNEIYLNLIAPMEESGYVLPDEMIPDISTGKMFSSFLRNKGVDPAGFPSYPHEFLDGKRPIVDARLYPNEFLADFREYFHSEWLPKHALRYFSRKDKKSLPHIKKILAGLPESKS